MEPYKIHYSIRFMGVFKESFDFVVKGSNDSWAQSDNFNKFVKEKDDGYLYIKDRRITDNKQGIDTIIKCILIAYERINGVNLSSYADIVFSIDKNGYVIVSKCQFSNNRLDLFLCKWLP